MARHGHSLRLQDLVEVEETNDKRRYAFNEDRTKIRAVQGHSRPVELGNEAVLPPERLFHGTVERFVASIRAEGMVPGRRQHVHLSRSRAIAEQVGQRRGRPVILTIDSRAMAEGGHPFYRADNGVWLARHVPAAFIVEWQ